MVFNGDFFFFNIKLLRFLYRKSQGSSDLIAVNFCTGSIVLVLYTYVITCQMIGT